MNSAEPERLYFDHNATTPLRPEAAAVVERVSREVWGNPSSLHAEGRRARAAIEESREQLAALLQVEPSEIVFTSGGTESNRLAFEGVLAAEASRSRGGVSTPHAVLAAIEHPSVLEVAAERKRAGRLAVAEVTADSGGRVAADRLAAAFQSTTRWVALAYVNSETGVVQDIESVAKALREAASASGGNPYAFHVDAVQALGKIAVRPRELDADLVSLSSHKVGGPRGVGALWIRDGAFFVPPSAGGPQERRRRPGTENVAAICGFVEAVRLSLEALTSGHAAEAAGRQLRKRLAARLPDAVLNGDPAHGLASTVNLSVPGVSGELLVIALDQAGVGVSMGSACASGSREPSHVLRAMGLPDERVRSAIRISCGWTTTSAEVEQLVERLVEVVARLRNS